MTSEQPTPAATPTPKRLSLRPHLITVVVGFLVLAHCVLSNLVHGQGWGATVHDRETIDRQNIQPQMPGPGPQDTNVYGWPWRWVAFSTELPGPTFDPDFCVWKGRALAANVGACLAFVVFAAAVTELAARRFGLCFKFGVRTALAGTAAVAILMGWYVARSRRIAQEDEIAELAEALGGAGYFTCYGPRWLKLVSLERHFAYLVAVCSTYQSDELTKVLATIQSLKCVEFFPDDDDPRHFTWLRQVEDVQLDFVDRWHAKLNESLAAMPNLKQLTVCMRFGDTDFKDWKALQSAPLLTQLVAYVDRPAPPENCRLEHLEAFKAVGDVLDESWAKWLSLQPRLRVIDLSDLLENAPDISALAGCQDLKTVVVGLLSRDSSALADLASRAPSGVQIRIPAEFVIGDGDFVPGFAVLGARPSPEWKRWPKLTKSDDRFGVWRADNQGE